MFEEIKQKIKEDTRGIFFKAVLVLSLVSIFIFLPIRIIFGCTFVDIIFTLIYSILGIAFYFIGISYLKNFKEREIIQEKEIKQLYKLTITDQLTQVRNRAYLFDKLSELSHSVVNRGLPVSLIIFDVDRFKQFNDSHGHLVGDTVLKKVAKIVDNNVRSGDIFGRYGGEEFLIIAPNTTKDKAYILSENVRKMVEEKTDGEITISIGLTQIKSEFDIDNALKRADDAMYKAKDNGRNQTMVG